MRHKNNLDLAAKFLGHRSASTTFRRYWKVDAEQLARDIPFFKNLCRPVSPSLRAHPMDSDRKPPTDERETEDDDLDDRTSHDRGSSLVSALEFEQQERRRLVDENRELRRLLGLLPPGCKVPSQVVPEEEENATDNTYTDEWNPLVALM